MDCIHELQFRDGIFGSPFVGLSNFEFLISSGELWTLTKNTILYNLVFILLGNVFQIVIALMLNEIRSKFFKKVSQTIMFLPYFISAVLIGAIAFNILNYGYASAIGVVLMLLCMLSVGISNRVFKTDETV